MRRQTADPRACCRENMLHTFSQMHEGTKPPETTAQGDSGQPGPPPQSGNHPSWGA